MYVTIHASFDADAACSQYSQRAQITGQTFMDDALLIKAFNNLLNIALKMKKQDDKDAERPYNDFWKRIGGATVFLDDDDGNIYAESAYEPRGFFDLTNVNTADLMNGYKWPKPLSEDQLPDFSKLSVVAVSVMGRSHEGIDARDSSYTTTHLSWSSSANPNLLTQDNFGGADKPTGDYSEVMHEIRYTKLTKAEAAAAGGLYYIDGMDHWEEIYSEYYGTE